MIRPFSGTRGDNIWLPARILPFPGTRPDSIIFRYSLRFDPFPVLVGTTFGYSHGFHLFPVQARILSFFGTPIDSTLFRYSWGQLLVTRTDPTFSRYSTGFFHFSVLPQIRPFYWYSSGKFFDTRMDSTFPGTRPDSTVFRNSHRFDPFPILVGTVFGYSHGSTFSRYTPRFYHFSVQPQIRPFFDTRRESFLTFARILPFPRTRPDSTIFRYSHRFDLFPVLVENVFSYSHGFYLFPVHARILSFFGTPTDSTLFRYSLGKFSHTRTDSTFSPYSPGFYHFSVLS